MPGFTTDSSALSKALASLSRIVERRTTIPVLSNTRLTVSGSTLALCATDLDIELRMSLEVDGQGDGDITVPAHIFADITRKCTDGAKITVTWEGEEANVIARSGRSRFTLQSLPARDFPELAAGDMPPGFNLPAADFAALMTRPAFAISTEETRYYLNGIYLHVGQGAGHSLLRAVATDGHRLACLDVTLPDGAEAMPGVIVPRKTVSELARLAKDAKGEFTVAVNSQKIRVTIGAVTLTSKLIDGTYPDYLRVIPTRNDKRAEASIEDLAAAVDRVSTITNANGRAVKLAFTEGKLTLTVRNPDAGDATDELPITYTSADLEIGFNGAYLADILAALSGDTAIIELAEPGSPALLTTPTDPAFCVVIMPMRV